MSGVEFLAGFGTDQHQSKELCVKQEGEAEFRIELAQLSPSGPFEIGLSRNRVHDVECQVFRHGLLKKLKDRRIDVDVDERSNFLLWMRPKNGKLMRRFSQEDDVITPHFNYVHEQIVQIIHEQIGIYVSVCRLNEAPDLIVIFKAIA